MSKKVFEIESHDDFDEYDLGAVVEWLVEQLRCKYGQHHIIVEVVNNE